MKTSASLLAIGAIILLCARTASAQGDSTPGVRINAGGTAQLSADQRAVQTCADALVDKILPHGNVRVRVVSPTSSQLFNRVSGTVNSLLDVSLTASNARTRQVLARSECIIDAAAHIRSNTVHVLDADALATVSSSDLRLASN